MADSVVIAEILSMNPDTTRNSAVKVDVKLLENLKGHPDNGTFFIPTDEKILSSPPPLPRPNLSQGDIVLIFLHKLPDGTSELIADGLAVLQIPTSSAKIPQFRQRVSLLNLTLDKVSPPEAAQKMRHYYDKALKWAEKNAARK